MDNADTEDSEAGRWMRTPAAARYLGLAPQTLVNRRTLKIGPPSHKMPGGRGARVRYDRFELDRWLTEGDSEGAP